MRYIMKQRLFSFADSFTIKDEHGNDAFMVEGQPVAVVSKEWLTFRDTYGIDVRPGEDDILMLSIAVAIDLMCHDDNNSQSKINYP